MKNAINTVFKEIYTNTILSKREKVIYQYVYLETNWFSTVIGIRGGSFLMSLAHLVASRRFAYCVPWENITW